MTALILPVLMGFVALAVDLGYAWTSKAQLEVALASSALACQSGISSGTTAATNLGIAFAGHNAVMGGSVVLTSSNFTFGNWTSATRSFAPVTLPLAPGATVDACKVSATLAVPLFFANVFGKSFLNIAGSAIAQFGSTAKAWNIVIAEDITGSFSAELASKYPQKANQALLDCLKEHAGSSSRMGYTEFTNVSNVMQSLQNVNSGYNALKNSIANTAVCDTPGHPACGGTGTDAGILGATAQLDSALGAGTISCTASTTVAGCTIVVVTDGQPNKYLASCTASPKTAQNCAKKAATAACAKGYSISAVYFNNDGGSSANVAALVCGGGKFFKAPTAQEIQSGTFGICSTLPPRLVYEN